MHSAHTYILRGCPISPDISRHVSLSLPLHLILSITHTPSPSLPLPPSLCTQCFAMKARLHVLQSDWLCSKRMMSLLPTQEGGRWWRRVDALVRGKTSLLSLWNHTHTRTHARTRALHFLNAYIGYKSWKCENQEIGVRL